MLPIPAGSGTTGFEARNSFNLTVFWSDVGTVRKSSAFLVIFSPISLLILLQSSNMKVPSSEYFTSALLSGKLWSFNHGMQGLD